MMNQNDLGFAGVFFVLGYKKNAQQVGRFLRENYLLTINNPDFAESLM